MVDARVEAQLLDDVVALSCAAGDADGAAAFQLGDLPDTEPTAPEAAETTTVSPGLGWPMSSSPAYAVMPGMPSTPSAVESGAGFGSSFRSSLPV